MNWTRTKTSKMMRMSQIVTPRSNQPGLLFPRNSRPSVLTLLSKDFGIVRFARAASRLTSPSFSAWCQICAPCALEVKEQPGPLESMSSFATRV